MTPERMKEAFDSCMKCLLEAEPDLQGVELPEENKYNGQTPPPKAELPEVRELRRLRGLLNELEDFVVNKCDHIPDWFTDFIQQWLEKAREGPCKKKSTYST